MFIQAKRQRRNQTNEPRLPHRPVVFRGLAGFGLCLLGEDHRLRTLFGIFLASFKLRISSALPEVSPSALESLSNNRALEQNRPASTMGPLGK